MTPLFHIALRSDWEKARRTGAYTTSTLGRTLAEVGFIHASRADQWTEVRAQFYADVTEPLVLLRIDPALLDVPVVEEPAAPGATETFPHIYGRLPVTAVVQVIPLDGAAASPVPAARPGPASPPGAPAAPGAPQESFTRIYFREVFFNLALVCATLAACAAGLVIGRSAGETGTVVGALVGLALGVALGVALYRRRHHRPAGA
ncbi:DUF952 domain-containing protein [Nocardioides sp. R1-1]|uniref:DUF952 domain-containing protein n=1 Tax=Nocardioides sp. R1-1 TaxID=3383502 RepID=UPI0038D0404D